MDEILLVDGYNIIHAWDKLFDVRNEPLEDCRDRLIQILSNYQGFRKIKIIVVFDAQGVRKSRTTEEQKDGLTIVYTGEKESADNYIERYVYKLSGQFLIRVATSDYLQQRIVLHSGGIRISARELLADVLNQTRKVKKVQEKVKIQKKNPVMNTMSDEVLNVLKRYVKGNMDDK